MDSAKIDNHNKLEVSISTVRLFSPNPQPPHRDSEGWQVYVYKVLRKNVMKM